MNDLFNALAGGASSSSASGSYQPVPRSDGNAPPISSGSTHGLAAGYSTSALAARPSLRARQVEAVLSMLRFNASVGSGSASATTTATADDPSTVWKVLVYDQFGQDIIGPLLKVSELREQGVTVHMLLHGDRQPIPDAPAVFFVAPTLENVKRLCEDIGRALYDSFYINFSSTLPRPLLEEMATAAMRSNSAQLVAQVYDQHLNFACPEASMFSLGLSGSYRTLNDPRATDMVIEELVERAANSLLSVLVTMSTLPVIRCARGNAAEMVARKLDQKLRDRILNSRGDAYVEAASAPNVGRPVLIILDRNVDLSTMLAHTWSYQGLVHDLLELKSNRISYMSDEKGRAERKVYDVDMGDFIWEKNASSPFPQMTEDLDMELNRYKKDTEEVTRSCGVSTLDEISSADIGTSAKFLKGAIMALPKLTERKRLLDMHMNIASALLKQIKQRSLDSFILSQEALPKQTKSSIMDLINNKGSPEDKMRMFLVWYLSLDGELSSEELGDYEKALHIAACDTRPIEFIKSIRKFARMTAMANASYQTQASKGNELFSKFSSIGSKFADNLKDSGLSSTFDTLISGVKNILPSSKNLPVSRITEMLIESGGGGGAGSALGLGGNSMSDDEFLFFDPKASARAGAAGNAPRPGRVSYQEAIVFMVGGGNYVEYQNLQELVKRQGSGKTITYGSTEILNAQAFLAQLAALSK